MTRTRYQRTIVTCSGIDGYCYVAAEESIEIDRLYPVIVARAGQPNRLLEVCGHCCREERAAHPVPCSTCGAVYEPMRNLSRWWYVTGEPVCRVCLRPRPGCCLGCITGSAWVRLCAGQVPIPAADCDCWVVRPGQLVLALCV